MRILLQSAVCCLGIVLLSGCMDGPFYALKRVNPFYVSGWNADRKLAPTFEDRYADLQKLERKIGTLEAADQAQWAEELDKLVKEDASPEIRKQAVRCISRIAADGVDRTLNTASTDEVEKVRLAACEAWQARGGTAARDMLLSMAQADESNSVRQAAVTSLATFNDPEVLSTLSNLLDDKSPAIQVSVVDSLASLTGQSFGGDFGEWKNYLKGNVLPSQPANSPITPGLSAPPVRTVSGPSELPQW